MRSIDERGGAQLSSDLGVGLSMLNKCVQQHPLPSRALRSNVPRGNTTI
jgi:transposase